MQRSNLLIPAVIAGLIILLAVAWYFSGDRNPDQDKLTDNQIAQGTAPDPQKRCAAQATYDLIKRDLFQRAAELRGSDQAAYDNLAGFAALRMENPVLESQDATTGALNCSGSLSLDLPPGVTVVGGRRTLTAEVDYTIQRAADGTGDVILLKNADGIIAPLATLARTVGPAQPAAIDQGTEAQADQRAPSEPTTNVRPMPAPSAIPTPAPIPPRPTAKSAGQPSFNCSNARTSGEEAVCSDGRLAALDVDMAAQYRRALSSASPEQRALLQRTRDRFLAYRDRCPSRQCIADAYVGRMREIRDIADGE